jgi:hypothetical protein
MWSPQRTHLVPLVAARNVVLQAGNRSTVTGMPLTFAYLGSDGLPRATDYQGWRRWFEGGGERQMKVKRSHAKGWEIDTWFQGCSTSEDGPFLFWEVSANHSSWSPLVRRFGTKEEGTKVPCVSHEGGSRRQVAGYSG